MVMLEGAKILFLAPKHIHHRGVGSGSETDFLFDQIWWEQGKFDEEKPWNLFLVGTFDILSKYWFD